MKDMILFPEDIDSLNLILNQLTVKANLLLAVLINKDGRLLTYQGTLEKIDTVSMAALVAGNSASTLAIANLMGETEFSTMYHQGKNRHIFIAVVDDNTFLCLVFDERTNIDRVKVFARQFDRQIKKALVQVYDKTEDQVDFDLGADAPMQRRAPVAHSPGAPMSFEAESGEFEFTGQPDNSREHHVFERNAFQAVPQNFKTTPPTTSSDSDNAVHISELNSPIDNKIDGEANDTNYLYLKKKIRETVKHKKENDRC